MSRPPQQQQPPVSFKTVPGRNKTQKWQQAKTYNYDGDDWGGYDPYDEYEQTHTQTSAEPPSQSQTQSSYAEPPRRQNSFDAGDDDYSTTNTPPRGRNFTNPEHVPQPLNTAIRTSPARSTGGAAGAAGAAGVVGGAGAAFPPRKSSIRQKNAPVTPVDKPLPFIRPSDIYRRMADEQERERRSMDSGGRPSLDSVQQRHADGQGNSPMDRCNSRASGNLDTVAVAERAQAAPPPPPAVVLPESSSSSSSSPDRGVGVSPDVLQEAAYQPLSSLQQPAHTAPATKSTKDLSPVLPPVSRISGFGSDFLQNMGSSVREHEHASPDSSANAKASSDTERSSASPVDQHMQSTLARVFGAPVENPEPSHVAPTGNAFPQPTGAGGAGTPRALYDTNGNVSAADHDAGERQYGAPVQTTRALPGHDPAADILSERQHAVPIHAIGRQDPDQAHPTTSSGLQHQLSSGFRSVVHTAFDRPDDSGGSVPPTPISRDDSQSAGNYDNGVSRSDTSSTADISPIMSRVPSAATAQQRQLERDAQVPSPIAEENHISAPTNSQSRPASGQHHIPRKPSPGHSRNVSAESGGAAGFQRGYRRSLDPRHSQDNSPARTPELGDGASRRVSMPMAAETFDGEAGLEGDGPHVPDQAAEMPTAHLEPAEGELPEPAESSALPTTGRGRSGTDYSVRESDLADAVNLSPATPSYSPPVAEDQRAMQQDFLRTHNSLPGSPGSPGGFGGARPVSPGGLLARNLQPASPSSPNRPVSPGLLAQSLQPASPSSPNRPVSPGLAAQGLGIARSGTPSGRDSPAKGRVREIAEKYTSLEDASRRNSMASSLGSGKSSWSNFRGGSEENLSLRRKGTGGSSLLAGEGDGEGEDGEVFGRDEPGTGDRGREGASSLGIPGGEGGLVRPGVESQPSFRPHLPGEWVSYAPTPAREVPAPLEDAGVSEHQLDDARDDVDPADEHHSPFTTPRASRIPSDEPVDLTPTTKKTRLQSPTDFSPNPSSPQQNTASALTQQVKDAGAALGASLMAMGGLASQARDFGSAEPAKPVEQPEMAAKTPYGDVHSHSRPGMRLREEEESWGTNMTEGSAPVSVASEVPPTPPAKDTPAGLAPQHLQRLEPGPGGRPISNYFSGAVAPLRTGGGHSREGSKELPVGQGRPSVLPQLSTDTGASDLESDRLRKEIVRSLAQGNGLQRESIMEDEEGTPAVQAKETEKQGPGLLDQRFSWETRPQQAGVLTTPPRVRAPESPEVKPEKPYERAQSKGLHIVNAGVGDEAETPVEEVAANVPLPAAVQDTPNGGERGLTGGSNLPASAPGFVSPMTKSQENFALPPLSERLAAARDEGDLRDVGPSPILDHHEAESLGGSDARVPSYYQSAAAEGTSSPTPTPPQPDEQQRTSSPPTSPSAAAKRQSAGQRLLPMREIMAIKSSPDRIRTYNDTRQQFADTDTGLSNWLSGMLVQRPEYASLSTPGVYKPPAALATTGTLSGRHKHSPSLATKLYGTSAGEAGHGDAQATGVNRTPTRGANAGESAILQQKGKELIKGASVLGGKAQAGAKGLFAKGKSRWGVRRESGGGDGKAPPTLASAAPSREPSASPAPPPSSSTLAVATPAREASTSPIPRAGTRTPSSLISSRPLSRTFSRLRERSRSKSTTRSKSSRPESLLLANSSLVRDSEDDRFVLGTTALVSTGVETPFHTLAGARIETWNEPDAALPPTPSGHERSGTPGKLGVLPSPGADTFSYDEQLQHCSRDGVVTGNEVGRDREMRPHLAAAAGEGIVFDPPIVDHDAGNDRSIAQDSLIFAGPIGANALAGRMVPQQPEPERKLEPTDDRRQASPTSAAMDYDGTRGDTKGKHEQSQEQPVALSHTSRAAEGATSAPAEPPRLRPEHQRKVSALASLPSQQRNASRGSSMVTSRPTTSVTPKTPAFAERFPDDEDELYATTPIVRNLRSPAPGSVANADGGDDDELYCSTPVAAKSRAPWQSPPRVPEIPKAAVTQPWHVPAATQAESGAVRGVSGSVSARGGKLGAGPDARKEQAAPELATAGDWDRQSEVSAEEHLQGVSEDKGFEDYGPLESRHSSVSSLGSPDTVIGNRISMVRMRPSGVVVPAATREPPVTTSQAVPAVPLSTEQASAQSGASEHEVAELQGTPSAAYQTTHSPGRSSNVQTETPEQHRFMSRPYHGWVDQTERAKSYIPTDQDPTGALNQEALGAGEEPPSEAIDIRRFGGPPTSTPPSRQRSLYRNSGIAAPPSEYENLRSSRSGTTTPITLHSRQVSGVSGNTGDRTSKRFSGFFRGPAPPETASDAPPPHAITPQYGLEGLVMTDTDAGGTVQLRQDDDKQKRRRSGLWVAFKRSPTASATNFSSRESSVGRFNNSRVDLGTIPATTVTNRYPESTAKPKTLQKPQRAVSAATPPTDLKKKPRFSRLGSLFGRSNTQRHDAEKQPNKLIKSQPPGRAQSQRQDTNPGATISGYDAYEAKQRQQVPDVQRSNTSGQHANPTMSSSYQQNSQDVSARAVSSPEGLVRPPSNGWYGPGEDQSPSEQMQPTQESDYSQRSQQRPPQFRRLHSQGFQRGLQEANIPEAFRPTETSYGKAPTPIGPPPEQQPPVYHEPPPPSRMPTLPTRQPYWNRQPSASSQGSLTRPPHQRQTSSYSGDYQSIPAIYSQPEPQRAQWPREAPLPWESTVQRTMAPQTYPQSDAQQVAMVDEETARSSAHDYADQQTPWSIAMPSHGDRLQQHSRMQYEELPAGGHPFSRGDAYPIPQGHQGMTSPPPGGMGNAQYNLPMSPQSPDVQQGYMYPAAQTPAAMMQQGRMEAGPQAPDMTNAQSGSYPSPPYTPQSPVQHYQPSRGQSAHGPYGPPIYQQQKPSQPRYYSPQQLQQQQLSSRPPSVGRPLTYQRIPSGYTGRRDDAAVSEQELMMRGASYPGQEWAPVI